MAWAFVGVSSVVSVTAATHTLTEPAGCQPGDLLVAVISSRIASTTSITLPAGWTLVAESKTNNVVAAATTSEASGMMAYIIRGDAEPDLTFTHPTAPSVALGRIVAYRGGNFTSPFDVGIGAKTSTNITAVSTTGLTTGAANELIVKGVCSGRAAAFSAHDAATDPTTSSASGSVQTAAPIVGTWQERQDSSTTTGADTALAIADAIRGTAGATGALTCTASVAGGHAQVAGAFRIETAATPGTSSIAQTGSQSDFTASDQNSGTVSSTITVPSDAQIVCVGVQGWCSEADYFTSMTFTKGGVDTAMTRVGTTEPGNGQTVALFYLVSPDTGSNKSLKYNWTGSNPPGETPIISVTFWKGIDTASPVRSSATSIPKVGNAAFLNRTSQLTAQDGDRVVAFVGGDTGFLEGTVDTYYNLNEVADCTNGEAIRHDGAWASFAPSGNLYVGADTATNIGYGGCAAIVLKPGATGVTGTLGTTEAPDGASMTGTVQRLAALATTEAPDTAALTGTVRWPATLAVSEGPDTPAFTATIRWSVVLSTTEAPDTASFLGTTSWLAVLSTTEAPDTAALAGSVRWAATLATTEAPDIAAFGGIVSWTATLASSEGADIVSFLGSVTWSAILAASEAPDIASFAGEAETPPAGTLAVAETPDGAVFAGTITSFTTLATTEAPDSIAFGGVVRWTASLSAGEAPDVTAFAGTIRWTAVLTTGEAPDLGALTGTVRWSATLTVTEPPDTAAFLGTVSIPFPFVQGIIIT